MQQNTQKKNREYQYKKITWTEWLKNPIINFWCRLDRQGYPLAFVKKDY